MSTTAKTGTVTAAYGIVSLSWLNRTVLPRNLRMACVRSGESAARPLHLSPVAAIRHLSNVVEVTRVPLQNESRFLTRRAFRE